MSLVKCSFRGEVIGLDICRSEEATAELMERWDGTLIVERIFEMPSTSSHRARVHLANKVLALVGSALVLEVDRTPAELTAQLAEESGREPAPLPNVPEQWNAPPEVVEIAHELTAQPFDEEALKFLPPDLQEVARSTHAMLVRVAAGETLRFDEVPSPDDMMRLQMAVFRSTRLATQRVSDTVKLIERSAAEQSADFADEVGAPRLAEFGEVGKSEELPLEMRDPRTLTGAQKAELAQRIRVQENPLVGKDPLTLTGQEKQALAQRGGLGKPKPRNPLAAAGIDPRTLTGAQKRALGFNGKRNEVVVPKRDPSVLLADERTELAMLRASQGPLHPSMLGDEWQEREPSTERDELSARKTWRKTPRPEFAAGEQ